MNRSISRRDKCYRFYWKMRARIAPQLEYSQAVYERMLVDVSCNRDRWLDVGCGHQVLPPWRADEEKTLVRSVKHVVGVDYDHASLQGHHTIGNRVRSDIESLPFQDGSFDLVTANMVLEHVGKPERLLAEVFRVLAPGGLFLSHTPNVWGYSTLLAAAIPEAIKPRLASWLHGRPEADIFPTHYRINSQKAFRRQGLKAGFADVTVEHLTSDAQLVMVPPLVVMELVALRLLMTRPLRRLRTYLLVTMEKPKEPGRRRPARSAGTTEIR